MSVAVASEPLVGQAVRFARERLGLSAKEVSRRAGLSPSYVSKVERGDCSPSVETFAAIAVALGMTPLEVWGAVVASLAASQQLLSQAVSTLGDTRSTGAQERSA